MTMLLMVLAALFFLVSPAEAGPVAAAIGAAVKAIAAWKIGTFSIGLFLLKQTVAYSLSLLARKKANAGSTGGIRSEQTMSGEGTSGSIILGKYATAGTMVAPPMTDGSFGKTPNAVLTYVIDLADMPITSLDGLWVDDSKIEFLEPAPESSDNPFPDHMRGGGKFEGKLWFRFFDGTQTEAYPGLIATDGNGRPWQADMVGTGIPYVVVRFRLWAELYQGLPTVLFEVTGSGLYDPRKDSTVGGTGQHRWGDASTYEASENPIVQVYNILRGITLPDGSVWGGGADFEDLPLNNWIAGMNACDVVIDGEPAYRSGYEVKIGPEEFGGDTPADVIDELLRGCSGQIAEFGGVYRVRVGGPGLPVMFLTDDDIVISSDQSLKPFQALQETYNAVHAQYPEPAERWANKEAPPRHDAGYLADDHGFKLAASLQLPTVTDDGQVQRLMLAYLRDARRNRVHELTLPPDYTAVDVLDSLGWTSQVNGYVNDKVFEVTVRGDSPRLLLPRFGLRERDGADYVYDPSDRLPTSTGSVTTPEPPPRVLIDFAVQGVSIPDGSGAPRRPGIQMTWYWDQPDARGVRFRIRAVGQTAMSSVGSIIGMDEGQAVVSEGILPATDYEVSAKPIIDRPTEWTDWLLVTTPDTRIGRDDIADDILDTLDEVGGIVDQVNADLAALSADVDLRVQAARDDLGDDIAAVELQLTQGLAAVDGRIETGIEAYDVAVQGQFASVAGEIAELTAALTSADLIQNGDFATGDMSYWTATGGGAIRERATSAVPLVQSAPTDYVRQVTYGGGISQQSQAFTASADDRFQVRFSVAGPNGQATNRQVELTAEWLDGSGAPIGSPDVITLGFQRNVWQVITHQFDPPDTAASAVLTFENPGAGDSWYVTAVSASTVNVEVLARVIALEAAQATTDSALSTFQTTALARFDATDAAVSTEAAARASADGALSDRLDTVETQTGTNAAAITAQQTAITNASEAITQIDERMVATFGRRQIVRDPVFDDGLTFWPVAGLGSAADLIARNTASEFVLLREMPARRAFRVGVGASGVRATGWYDCAPGEVFALSAHFFQQANAPSGLFWVQFQDASNALLPAAFGVRSNQIGAWHISSRRDVIAPEGAVKIRAMISLGDDGTGAGGVYLTNLLVDRLLGFEFMAASEFTEVRQAQADANGAFSAYVSSANSRFNGIDGTLSSHATALSNRYTRAEADAAMASATSGVTARTNRASASGLMRVTSVAAGSNALTRIGLMAEATSGSTNSSAGLYLDARSDGVSQVSVVASRFAVVSGTGGDAPRAVPFYVADGVVYMDTAVVRDLSIGVAKIGNNALYVPYNFSRSDVGVTTADTKASPRLIYNQTLTDFEGGGFLVSFDADLDALGTNDTFGTFFMQVNGVEVSRSKYGARTSGGDTIFIMPVSMIAASAGGASVNIKVYAYSSHWENDNNPSKNFWLRNVSLSVAGSRR